MKAGVSISNKGIATAAAKALTGYKKALSAVGNIGNAVSSVVNTSKCSSNEETGTVHALGVRVDDNTGYDPYTGESFNLTTGKGSATTKGTGKAYVTLEQMKNLGWSKIHYGYVVKSTGKVSPQNDMTSVIDKKYRDINQGDVNKINALLKKYDINTKQRIAAFFAECSAETGNGTRFLEGAGTPEKPFVGSVTRTNLNKWFDDNTNYGSKYRGAGAIQLTWDYHYEEFEKWMSTEFGITDTNITNKGAEYVAMNYTWEAAVFYWNKNNLNSKADTGDIHKVTAVVNKKMSNKEYQKREEAYDLWMKNYIYPY